MGGSRPWRLFGTGGGEAGGGAGPQQPPQGGKGPGAIPVAPRQRVLEHLRAWGVTMAGVVDGWLRIQAHASRAAVFRRFRQTHLLGLGNGRAARAAARRARRSAWAAANSRSAATR